MSYRIKRMEALQHTVRRIACEQIDKAIAELDDPQLARPKAVHQLRKRCKKLRGLLRLVRPGMEKTYAKENVCFRDTARLVASDRDGKVLQDTYDLVMRQYRDQIQRQAFAPVRAELTRRRKALLKTERDPSKPLKQAGKRLRRARERVEQWKIEGKPAKVVAAGLAKTYGRAREAWSDLDAGSAADQYHELRKRTKYHMYHCRLLESLWPDMWEARENTADELGSRLGDAHDLAVLAQTVATFDGVDAQTLDVFQALIEQHRRTLERDSRRIAATLFGTEKTAAFESRITKLYRQFRKSS